MTRNQFKKLKAGDRVTVFSFGNHPGVVAAIAPTVTIQGREITPADWVKVKLDDGREWNGHFKVLDFNAPAVRRTA